LEVCRAAVALLAIAGPSSDISCVQLKMDSAGDEGKAASAPVKKIVVNSLRVKG
jgi:hypothetical protein